MRTLGIRCITMASLVALLLPGPASSAQTGSADTAGGYGWQVLEKVLPQWHPAAGGPLTLTVRIGSNGEVLYCDTRSSSGDRGVDMNACSVVAGAAPFAAPPRGLPVEVYLSLPGAVASSSSPSSSAPTSQPLANEPGQSLMTAPGGSGDQAPQVVSSGYADTVMSRIRQHLKVPAGFTGEAVVVAHLRIDEKGHIVKEEIIESSGTTPAVNEAVLNAIRKAGTMPPPPTPTQRLVLTFTVRGL